MGNRNSGPRPAPTALKLLRGSRKDRLNPRETTPPPPEGPAPPAGPAAPGRGGRDPGDTLPPGPRDLGSTGPRLPGHGDLNPGGPGRLRGPLRITGDAGIGLRAEGIGPISAHFQERPDSRRLETRARDGDGTPALFREIRPGSHRPGADRAPGRPGGAAE